MLNTWDIGLDIIFLWFFFELIFFFVISVVVHSSLQQLKKPPAYEMNPISLIRRMCGDIDKLSTYSYKKYLSGWFCGADISEIKRENLMSFLSWVSFAEFHDKLSPLQLKELENIFNEFCERFSLNLEEGYNYNIRHVKMTLEPVLFMHRPLFLYVAFGIYSLIGEFLLSMAGFKRCKLNKLKYWYRPQLNASCELPPMAFFHGITTGWGGAMSLINQLGIDRELFLFELDCIKINSLKFYMPSAESYSNAVRQVFDSHGISQNISLVGHSFGSITAGWFVKSFPEYVGHITLIDPVSLLLHLPDVAFNFLYRKPFTVMEWAIHLVASREITISNTLRRNFWWYKNITWLEDIPSRIGVVVSLGGGDEVANAPSVQEYVLNCHQERQDRKEEKKMLRSCNRSSLESMYAPISCIYHHGQSHAEILLRNHSIAELSKLLHLQEKSLF